MLETPAARRWVDGSPNSGISFPVAFFVLCIHKCPLRLKGEHDVGTLQVFAHLPQPTGHAFHQPSASPKPLPQPTARVRWKINSMQDVQLRHFSPVFPLWNSSTEPLPFPRWFTMLCASTCLATHLLNFAPCETLNTPLYSFPCTRSALDSFTLHLSHNRFGLKGCTIGWTCIEKHSPGGWSCQPTPLGSFCGLYPPSTTWIMQTKQSTGQKTEENRGENNNKALETNVFSKFNISSFVGP